MNLDPEFEASFVRVVGLMSFILATIAFFLMLSGMTDYQGQDLGALMFLGFIMCTALALAGLMISTLAQILAILQKIETLLAAQNDKLDSVGKASAPKPRRASTKKKTS